MSALAASLASKSKLVTCVVANRPSLICTCMYPISDRIRCSVVLDPSMPIRSISGILEHFANVLVTMQNPAPQV